MAQTIYCKGDGIYHHKSDLPKNLQPFWGHVFSSGAITGDDFDQFNTKFKNAVKKLLPVGFNIHKWVKGHYYCSAVISTPDQSYIYISIPDVRYDTNAWFANILYRKMAHERDWTGDMNRYASLFNLSACLEKLWQ